MIGAIHSKSELEAKDRELIKKVSESEPYFTTHPAHEARAHRLTQRGYFSKEQAVYSIDRGGTRMEYRWRYTLTARGRRELS